MIAAHCDWCADPWRAVILGLIRQGVRQGQISRKYGLPRTSIAGVCDDARRFGCLQHQRCRYCERVIPSIRAKCWRDECRRAYNREVTRIRRARFGLAAKTPEEMKGAGRLPKPGVVWPELPANPRARKAPTPRHVPCPPIVHVTSLYGVGNHRASVRQEALEKYAAQYAKASMQPVGDSGMVLRWRNPRAKAQTQRTGWVLPPPRCAPIGGLPHCEVPR